MQHIINEYNIFIHNNKIPTCHNKSKIDLTISNRHSLKLVNNWQTFELTKISDHVTVSFDINVNLDITNNQQKSTWKFSEKKADWSLFSNTISKQEVRRLQNDIKKVEKETDIDMVVERLTDIILEAAYQSLEVKSSNFTFDTGIKWLNKELEQKKKYIHYVRNLYFHHKAISVNEYKSVRNEYKNSIRKAKRNSWLDFIEENGSNNPFGNAYRTLKKLCSSNQQKGLPIIEQAPVDSKETLIKDLINELIPDDTTISDTAHHTSIRNYTPNFTNSNSCNIHKKEIEELIDKINAHPNLSTRQIEVWFQGHSHRPMSRRLSSYLICNIVVLFEAHILTVPKVEHTVVSEISLAPSDTNLRFILERRSRTNLGYKSLCLRTDNFKWLFQVCEHWIAYMLAFAMTINKAQGQTLATRACVYARTTLSGFFKCANIG
ncbi:hypothetical protein LAZ67_6001596 [Cordylochernes scorpioides]|uniref:Homeobox domain-containing protein n=1 Tax=Cordylochernes scorpioides TaxID=51811 RepID=A0ABY6KMD2_9ARAC|nr:hypothetical protein LAZ67_6001596 [Cordylochernes scorpioides]